MKKLFGVGAAVVALGVLIGLYVSSWATSFPRRSTASAPAPTRRRRQAELRRSRAIGPEVQPRAPRLGLLPGPPNGQWVHSTIFKVPANSIVHVTIYQFDSPTGLRNPFLSQVQGTVGGTMTVDGKTVNAIQPEEASHTFAVPELGVFVPLPGVPEEAKNPCEFAPCEASTRPTARSRSASARAARAATAGSASCRARPGFLNGNGGPMQTLG